MYTDYIRSSLGGYLLYTALWVITSDSTALPLPIGFCVEASAVRGVRVNESIDGPE
jgi:hypothetical protein